ncbi:MAG: serine/threonine protein kinase [Gemmataceae bacterium]|nr:serine/threonine protein kinase [Gemmataceae bacterium]
MLDLVETTLDMQKATGLEAKPVPELPVLPNYEILAHIGSGGMGVVFKARDLRLGRLVAVKLLPPGRARPEALQRFAREARALARLRHDHIVPIFEAELHGGRPYFVMEFATGGSLAAHSKKLPGQPTKVVALMTNVARAVHYAHEHGILHRDLKPGNILLDEHGKVMVVDFGLAKMFDQREGDQTESASDGSDSSCSSPPDESLTAVGAWLGTAAYMAPEQVRGQSMQVGPGADLWALGVILYELLVGRLPFEGNNYEVATAICDAAPPSPRHIHPHLDRAIEAIILKCLEKKPALRYPSAAALADDLEKWQRGEAPTVLKENRARRAWRWVKRHPALSAAAALLIAFASIMVAFPPWASSLEVTLDRKYRAAVAPFEEELAAGRAVSLVGADLEFPYRSRIGDAVLRFPENAIEKGTVTITAAVPSLVELLNDPQTSSYRLRVEMRQDGLVRQSPAAEVGVYFGSVQRTTTEGLQFFVGRVSFADLGHRAMLFKTKAGELRSLFQIGFLHRGESANAPYQRTYAFGGAGTFYAVEEPDKVPGPWRQFTIEVRPERIEASWDGRTVALIPAVEYPQALASIRREYSDLESIPPVWSVRAPLGVYVDASVVSIRRFVVEPLVTPE